jgi:tetratricopeptide (TPR) repeat protein
LLAVTHLGGAAAAVEVRGREANMSDEREINAESLLAEADSLFKARDYEQAMKVYTETIENARSEFNRPVETEALAQVARVNLIQGNSVEADRYLGEAAERASDSDPMGFSRYLGVKGRFEWKAGNLKKSRETFDQMYVYCNTNGLWARAVDAAHMIAIVAESVDEQIEWGRRGIEAAEAGGVDEWLGPLWNNLGATYYDDKQFEYALDAYLKARDYHWQFSGESAKLWADYSVGMSYRMLGQFDKAGQWLRPVLAWAERLGDNSAIGQACEDLGEIAIAQGRKSDGLSLLKRAREEYKKAGFDQSWKEVWDNINTRIAELD